MAHRSPFQKIVRLENCIDARYGIDAIFVYIKMNVVFKFARNACNPYAVHTGGRPMNAPTR